HADRDDARQQNALVFDRHVSAADHDSSEDEDEEQGLQKRLEHDLNNVAPRHLGVAGEHRAKSFPVQSRKLLPVWCRNRFSRLGSEMCTSDNSAPTAAAIDATSGIRDPPRSASPSAPVEPNGRTSRTPASDCKR